MKLQHKLALYNTFTKIAVVGILISFILLFVGRISYNHLQKRLLDKRDRLIKNLSQEEIDDLLNEQKKFTDYNILKEEYIILNQIRPEEFGKTGPKFTKSPREIEGNTEEFLILTNDFRYKGQSYRLEIGETMAAVQVLEATIKNSALLVIFASLILTLIADFAFTRFLFAPFYKIVDQKIIKVNDPIHFNHEPVKTTTTDFQLLDSSISSLMKKISGLILTEKQFITNVSHELLTPISVLRTRLENMLNDTGISVDSQTKIVSSLKTLARLKAVINSLLLISKVENDQFTKSDSVLIPEAIDEILEDLEDRILSKKIQVDIDIQNQFHFTANRALIHTLFMNIINNAVKYNKQNGKIRIRDRREENRYTVFIEDEGIGMPADQTEKAFQRFETLNSHDNSSHGLGLAIVKSIAAFHRIEVRLSSKVNVGTTVALSFPVSR